MSRWVDPEDGLQELAELWSASTAEELHRVLVLHPVVRRSADAYEPFALLAKHHESEPDSSLVTAVLLLTDPRWRGGVSHLVRHIENEGPLDADALDLLARTFLSADKALYWQVPDDWFDSEGIDISFDDQPFEEEADEDEQADEPVGPTVARRDLPPPLRRWAAARIVKRDPSSWGAVFDRTRHLDPRSSAAVMNGLLDVVEMIQISAQNLLITAALDHSSHEVRRLGLGLLAERDGFDAAHARAITDPNARIRAWAEARIETEPPASSDRRSSPTGPRTPVAAKTVDQPTLF
jgi:hypothetical protein